MKTLELFHGRESAGEELTVMNKVQLNTTSIPHLQQSLLQWYTLFGRDLPWRHNQDPYKIWISEIMLQQTQVKTVIPYFHRWLIEFPTLISLANASQQQVLKAWEGLGYYARARNLHQAAQQMVRCHTGEVPPNLQSLLTLPGIGRTTAGGILSSAYNQPISILDTNVKRVLARLIALPVPVNQAIPDLWKLTDQLLSQDQPRDFNQALMDLGAMVCLPKHPSCSSCPWQSHCQAHILGKTMEIPSAKVRQTLPHKLIGVAVIRNQNGEILIDRRRQGGLLGGLWEFPGGKIEPGETVEECIHREIQEELGILVTVGDPLITIDHTYSHFWVTLYVHHCQYLSGEPQPLECDEIRWVTLEQLTDFPFPKANTRIIEALKEALME